MRERLRAAADAAERYFASRLLLTAAVCSAAGIAAAEYAGSYGASLSLAVCGVAGAVFLRRRRLAALAVFSAASFGAVHGLDRGGTADPVPGEAFPVRDLPALVREARPLGSAAREWQLEVAAAADAAGWIRRGMVFRLRAEGEYSPGDMIAVTGTARVPSRPRNPGEFDRGAALRRAGVAAELVPRRGGGVEVTARRTGPLGAAAAVREWIASAISEDLDDSPDVAALLKAMTLGMRDEAPDEMEDCFRFSGTMHLFAISGLHVGIFGLAVWWALRPLGLSRRHAALLIIPLAFGYAFVTGWRPSAVRAAVMLSVVLAGVVFERRPRLLNSLGAAALLILAFDTGQLFAPGFQLSFAVLLTIAALAGRFRRLAAPWADPDPFMPKPLLSSGQRARYRVTGFTANTAAVSAAAWIGSAPLIVWHFDLVTPLAVPANILLVPLAFAALWLAGLSVALTAVGLGQVAVLANNANWAVAKLILAAAAGFSGLPGSHYQWAARQEPARDVCRVTVLDLGRGAAQIVQTKNAAWLVDAGAARDAGPRVEAALRARGVSRLDGLAVTHGDADHAGGATRIMERFRPRRVVLSPHRSRSPAMADLRDHLAKIGQVPEIAAAGDVVVIDRRTRLEALHPEAGADGGRSDDSALVLRLSHRSRALLLASDIGFSVEKLLLRQDPARLRADVLVSGRHGDGSGGSAAFVRAVAPDAVIGSSAAFPATEQFTAERAERLAALGVRVFNQARTGAVTIRLSDASVTAAPFLGGGLE